MLVAGMAFGVVLQVAEEEEEEAVFAVILLFALLLVALEFVATEVDVVVVVVVEATSGWGADLKARSSRSCGRAWWTRNKSKSNTWSDENESHTNI